MILYSVQSVTESIVHNITVLKVTALTALAMQSYVLTEDDNRRLNNSNTEVFEWLVTVLDCAISGVSWHDFFYSAAVLIMVRYY